MNISWLKKPHSHVRRWNLADVHVQYLYDTLAVGAPVTVGQRDAINKIHELFSEDKDEEHPK